MAYIDLDDLRAYLKIGDSYTDDDALLTLYASEAQRVIEEDRHRSFEATTATRYYTREDVCGKELLLGADLLTVTTLTNGNEEEIESDYYRLWPLNEGRYTSIRLLSTAYWSFDTDGLISVAGTWGWSATPPEPIVLATKMLAGFYYRGKDAQAYEVTGNAELGQVIIPKGIPATVQWILNRYPLPVGREMAAI